MKITKIFNIFKLFYFIRSDSRKYYKLAIKYPDEFKRWCLAEKQCDLIEEQKMIDFFMEKMGYDKDEN